jgi:serine/threonine protein kinase
MSTTAAFQSKPDFYPTKEECVKNDRKFVQTNSRYKNFGQTHFTAGDEEQFETYRDATNNEVCIPEIPLSDNLFAESPHQVWSKYKNVGADAVVNTFRYMFHKFKKGIFVKIANGNLRVFLPFSKVHYTNEWSHQIQIDQDKYGSVKDFIRILTKLEGYNFTPSSVNHNIDEWYGNNCLVRYEYPPSEGDTNTSVIRDMLKELCDSREMPDIEFFINKRDFPLLTKNGTEPYNNIWDTSNLSLVSHSYEKYIPILSMSISERYADVPMPTCDDWARVQNLDSKWFPRLCRDYPETFDTKWEDKIPSAVFRGGSTGCGVTIETNPRLMLAYLSHTTPVDEDGVPYIDAGITNWNLRPRKIEGEKYLKTIEIGSLPFGTVPPLSLEQQSRYKYVINVDGHVAAFRLSIELNMGSVVLLAVSQWRIWYSAMLTPYEHYVPVKQDLSDLVEQIKWCRQNDAKCLQIARNAKKFYDRFLQKKGILDYMQRTLVNLKSNMGVYLYNTKSPLDTMIEMEYGDLDFSYPELDDNKTDVFVVPTVRRSYGLLSGVEWVVRKLIKEGNFEALVAEQHEIFKNKLGSVRRFSIANFCLVVKTTTNCNKRREHVHEAFIGTKSINEVIKHIPNFAYTFGLYRKADTFNLVTEYIPGESLFEYMNGETFEFGEFLFVVIQICLAIQVAQNLIGLVHYDLTPWNIMLHRLEKPEKFDYILAHDKIVRVETSLIPIIIDYGKSHVIYDGVHHGFIDMFRVCPIQDIVTFLVISIDHIAHKKRLSQTDFGNLLYLANFISGTGYRKDTFTSAKDLRAFFRKSSKYAVIIADNKHELKNREPYDLVTHITKLRKIYNFKVGFSLDYMSTMNEGNGRQVFEYIFSGTTEERLQTYENAIERFKRCAMPQPANLLFVYYGAQQLEKNLTSIQKSMLAFLKTKHIDVERCEKLCQDTIDSLIRLYRDKIEEMDEESISCSIQGDFPQLVAAPYNNETFLRPSEILGMMQPDNDADYSEYKEIIETVLLEQGTFKLSSRDRQFCEANLSNLLSQNSLTMKNNSANAKTLNVLVRKMYQANLKALRKCLRYVEGDCEDAVDYLRVYRHFD